MEYRFGSYGVQVYGGNLVEEGRLADFPLVGSNRYVSGEMCNVFGRNWGCLNHRGHVGQDLPKGVLGQAGLDGKIVEGMAVIYPSAQHCSDPLCPVCCLSWARKQNRRALRRFEVFDDVFVGFDDVHVTVSVPEFDWDKGFEFLKRQALAFAEGVGVVGGLVMYHPKRVNRGGNIWFFSPHFHIYGKALGGLVDGLLVRDLHNLSGYVLVNLERRKSRGGTLMYQLSHAGIPFGHKHAVSWFGELNYRKGGLHSELLEVVRANEMEEKRNAGKVCPVCGQKMVHVCRVASAVKFEYAKFEDCFVLDLRDNWVKVELPRRWKKEKVLEDDGYDDFVKGFGGDVGGEEIS